MGNNWKFALIGVAMLTGSAAIAADLEIAWLWHWQRPPRVIPNQVFHVNAPVHRGHFIGYVHATRHPWRWRIIRHR